MVDGVTKRVPFLLAGLLLAASLSGESSTGRARATASTTVSVSIPALYGIRLPEEDAETSEPGEVVFASLEDGEAGGLKFRFAILTTMGDGSVVLRRSLLEDGPSGERGLLHAARGKSNEHSSGSSALYFFASGAFGWKSLEESLRPTRSERISDRGNPRVVRVVYELWHF